MRIFSKFKDYYDSGMSMGYDNKIHYNRVSVSDAITDKSIIKKVRDIYHFNYNYGINFDGIDCTNFVLSVLLFCNEAIPVIKISYYDDKDSFDAITHNKYFFGDDIKNMTKNKHVTHFIDNYKSFYTKEFIINQHIKYGSPIIHCKYRLNVIYLDVDINLKEIEFYRYKDTYQAYQDISLFMGNTLIENSTPKMPVGDDKVILNSKGFDPKYGFRTRPKNKK